MFPKISLEAQCFWQLIIRLRVRGQRKYILTKADMHKC